MPNPWMKEKCETCNKQILTPKNLGIASMFSKDNTDPWNSNEAKEIEIDRRIICIECSIDEGYDG